MKYEKILKKINKKFKKANIVLVNNEKTVELVNVNYKLDYDATFASKLLIEPHGDDEKERNEIIYMMEIQKSKFLIDDIHSRQCVVQKTYKNITACITTLQILIRDNKVNLYVFIRSQNYKNNFYYDCQTLTRVLKLFLDYFNLKPGKIYVHTTSLHKIIED